MPNETQPATRGALATDAEPITALLAELGYPDNVERVRERLARLIARHDTGVLVAETHGQVLGIAAYQLTKLLERPQPSCRITTLVVQTDARRSGCARILVAAVETLANEQGCFRIEVTTDPKRAAASGLYTALGFAEQPRRLVKPLAPH